VNKDERRFIQFVDIGGIVDHHWFTLFSYFDRSGWKREIETFENAIKT